MLLKILPALVAIGLVVFLLMSRSTSQRHAGAPADPGFSIDPAATKGVQLVLEAEASAEVEFPASLDGGDRAIRSGASDGKCCFIGPEKWNEKWKKGQVEGKHLKGHPKAENPGYLRMTLEAPAEGRYELWVRCYWVDDCGNSLLVVLGDPQSDGFASRQLSVISGTTFGQWTWNPLLDSELEPQLLSLKKGPNILTICNREDDLYIDQVLLREAGKRWADPKGIVKHR